MNDRAALPRASRDPETAALRVNTLRTSPEALRSTLGARGFRLEPVPGLPGFLRVLDEPIPISRTLEYWKGLFYLQQTVTGTAALALGARPGERVLDLCAAPGGKTGHLAERLQERGIVVAGESNEGRMRALVGNLYRLGHAGVLSVAVDGRTFPGGARFDRVLVDAPCSGEGNRRTRSGAGGPGASVAEGFRGHITGVQRALLARAVELTRPGGTILYSTCTFAPEENEGVVSYVMQRHPVSLEAIDLDIPHAPGLTRFEGKRYDRDLELAWRLYPEHLDSGGLFLARLRRDANRGETPADPDAGWTPVPPMYPDEPEGREDAEREVASGLAELHEWMGLAPGALEGARWMRRGDSIWLHTAARWPLAGWGPDALQDRRANWRFTSLGLRAFRCESGGRLRPTNDLMRRIGPHVQARVVETTRASCLALVESGETAAPGLADGYAAIRLEGDVIGRGFVRGGRLRHELGHADAASLAEALRIDAREAS